MDHATNTHMDTKWTIDDLRPAERLQGQPEAYKSTYVSNPLLYGKITEGSGHPLDKDGNLIGTILTHYAYKPSILQPMLARMTEMSPECLFFTWPWNFTATGSWKDFPHLTLHEYLKHLGMEIPHDYKGPAYVRSIVRRTLPLPSPQHATPENGEKGASPEMELKRKRSTSPAEDSKKPKLDHSTTDWKQLYIDMHGQRIAHRKNALDIKRELGQQVAILELEKQDGVNANAQLSEQLEAIKAQLAEEKKAREALEAEKADLDETVQARDQKLEDAKAEAEQIAQNHQETIRNVRSKLDEEKKARVGLEAEKADLDRTVQSRDQKLEDAKAEADQIAQNHDEALRNVSSKLDEEERGAGRSVGGQGGSEA